MPNKINQSFDKLNVVSFRSSNSSGKLSINEELKKYNITREPVVLLEDVNLDKNLEFVGDTVVINEERRKKFTCYICMAKFSSAQSMSKHRALHSDSELDDNDTLSEDTWSKSKSKTVPPQNLIPKPKLKPKDSTENINKDCGETVVTKEPQKVTSFKCETCDVYFESSDDAKLHTVSNKCKFFCKICGRKFNTLYAFVVHLMQHRSNAAKSQNSSNMVYKCATCNKSFDNCLLLRSHEINAHQPKPDKVPSNPEPVANTSKEETSTVVKEEPVEPPIDDPADDTQPNEICCELCYDVFESAEDLEAHMEFHKQLETKTNTIVIEDDEDEVVEVYEEKKDPNEIITTIKSTTKPPQTRQAVPPSMNPTLLTTTSVTTASNHALTDTIKDMLTPKVEKQSKTILLPPVALPRLIPISKLKQSLASSQKSTAQPENTDLELRRTGPLSYSLCFKEDGTSSLGSSTSTAGTSNVGLKTSSPAVSNAVPLYASALINPSPVSIAPSTSSTSAVTASSNLQFFITNVPYVSGLQAAPINNALPTVTNNIAANTSSALATSSINASNITYVVAPSNAFVPPILVNDPEKNLAYVILPHNNSSIVNPTESVTTPKIQTTETSNSLPAVLNTTPQAVTSTTTTTSTGQFQSCVPMATGEASPLPVIANYFTTGGKPGANVLKTTIARTESTSTSDTANSNAKPSKPGPSKELEDSIVIDSDSSNEDNREENRVIKNNTGNESESDALVIDESSVTTEKNEGEVNAGSKDEDDKTEKKKYKFPMKCNGCSVIFQRMKSMRHHLDRRHCCQLCDFKCCKASDFKQHYILAHRKFFCSRCSVLADTKRSFTEHNRRNHICQECNGFFFNLAHHTCPKVREIASNGSKDDGKK